MKTVLKYEIELADHVGIYMPIGAKYLHVGVQNHGVMLWAEVDSEAYTKLKYFYLRGTGDQIPEDVKHIGSVQDEDYIWHLYEKV